MVDEETKEEKEEMIWDPGFPKCPKCGYPRAQPPKCISCGQKLVEEEEPEKPEGEEEPEKPEKPEESDKPEGEKPEEKPDEPEDLDELMGKTREELDAIATEKGLDPSDYANKEEITKAILETEE